MLISSFWKIAHYIDRNLTPIVSYDKNTLYARYLRDNSTGNVILGGFDGWFPYNELTDCYGLPESYSEKKFLITNSSKVYFDKRESINNIRYIPSTTFFVDAYSSTVTDILDESNISLNKFGALIMQAQEMMQHLISVKENLDFDLYIPIHQIGDTFRSIVEYWYNSTDEYFNNNIFLSSELYNNKKMFIYNPVEYENYIFMYNNLWTNPYVFNDYEYIISKDSPNTYKYVEDIIKIFDISLEIDCDHYSKFKLIFEDMALISSMLMLYSAQLLNNYEIDNFADCLTEEDLRNKAKYEINLI